MKMFNTNQMWTELAETGRANLQVLSPADSVLREQINTEADEEGVRVRMDFKPNKMGSYTAYVYLRKN